MLLWCYLGFSPGILGDSAGVTTFKNSLLYEILFAAEEQIRRIMDEVLSALNQESILVEKEMVDAVLYQTVGLDRPKG